MNIKNNLEKIYKIHNHTAHPEWRSKSVVSRGKGQKHGYILILTLMMIATATVIGTYIFIRGSSYVPYMRTMIEQEKAQALALGGVQVAVSQLSYTQNKQASSAQQPANQQNKQQDQKKELLMTILPIINRWQIFPLKEKVDGVSGDINVCLMCEDGKINLNDIYDFQKHVFKGANQQKGDWQKIMKDIMSRVGQLVGGADLFSALEKFLKKQQYQLNDVTQLLNIKEFAVFKDKVFYQPSPEQAQGKIALYLTDLFTVHSSGAKLEPWLLSDSLLGVLKLKQAAPGQIASRKKSVKKWLTNFKPTVQWNKDWNKVLKPIYGKDLPKTIESVLSSTFEPQWFSVLSYGKVGRVTARCMAIMQLVKRASNGKTGYDVSIRKLYWL